MKDRIVQYPNRYKLTQVSGDTYDLTPVPGVVTAEGTPLNKANLLSDATVGAIEQAVNSILSSDTPNAALAALAGVVGTNGVRIATGTYIGTGTFGEGNPSSLTFDFVPKVVFISSANYACAVLLKHRGINTSGTAEVGIASMVTLRIVSWNTMIKWYGDAAIGQANNSGTTYDYVAVG